MNYETIAIGVKNEVSFATNNTNVIFKICQYFKNLTVVYADGIKQIVQ